MVCIFNGNGGVKYIFLKEQLPQTQVRGLDLFFKPWWILRIDNSRQGMIRATLLHSEAILSTVSCYTSNCR